MATDGVPGEAAVAQEPADAHYDYDLVVVGSGPGGQKAAIAAAKLGHRVAIIERRHMMGGVSTNTGTIPSKTLREAVMYLTGMAQREVYGASYRVKSDITMEDLFARTQHVIGREHEVIRAQLLRNHVDILNGTGSFVDAHTVAVLEDDGVRRTQFTARFVVIATGSKPHRPSTVQFDERTVLDSDGLLALEKVPNSMVVVGAGIIGIEYASMFAALGTRVTVIDKRPAMLEMCDPEVAESLKFHLRDLSVSFRFGEEVAGVDSNTHGTVTRLASGKRIAADTVMYSAGRQGQTDALNLAAAGLSADSRGRITVDARVPDRGAARSSPSATSSASPPWPRRAWTRAASRRTTRSGSRPASCSPCSPSASTRSRRSRTAAAPRRSSPARRCPTRSASPAIASWRAGRSSATPTACSSCWSTSRRASCSASTSSGRRATDLVHIGQAVMACGGTVDYFVDTVFNYPTLSEAYKVAALDATNKIRQVDRFSS